MLLSMHLRYLTPSLATLAQLISAAVIDTRQSQIVFKHPGVFVSQAQLTFTKANIKISPWKDALAAMDYVPWGKLDYTPVATAMVRCEDPDSPDADKEKGCEQERNDALAAYSMALRWAYTGQTQYAEKAIKILDLWSSTLKGHVYSTYSPEQVGLQCGWAATSWTRAAEIIRHTGAGWTQPKITQFENFLKTVYLPEVRNGSAYNPNNIDSVMLEAAQGIAIFTNDSTLYTSVMKRFKEHVPSYIYLSTDGSTPKPPGWTKYYTTPASVKQLWQYDESYFTGRSQETCRDLEHTSYGLASISHMLETAYIQGENLYASDMSNRLKATFEFHSLYPNGGTVDSSICKGSLSTQKKLRQVAEPFYNGYVTRAKNSLPNTKKWLDVSRPAGPNYLFTAWETLTHAQNPN